MIFLPKPAHIEYDGSSFRKPKGFYAALSDQLAEIKNALASLWPELKIGSGGAAEEEGAYRITFTRRQMEDEAYCLDICGNGACISCSGARGAFYGMMTLRQAAMQCDGQIPCCHIEDKPGLSLRGALLDISRGKVMTPGTLYKAVDLLASLKYNHLELYIEGFSFGYPSFPEVWCEASCLTAGELASFSGYCAERFIEAVPHQNSLGHMSGWLSLPQFSGLAEAEGGLQVMGFSFPPTTLDAADARSLELVARLTDDLLPCFDSSLFHVGLDEPFELGKGKNKAVGGDGIARDLVLPYIGALHKELSGRGKRMMMWDDLVVRHPELLGGLPDDILICDWGYDAEFPVEKRAAMLRDSGREFAVCPGTSSWLSFTGLTDNMLENIRRAASAAYEFGAAGMIVTDWGDMGHLQYLPVSYPGLAYAAACAWNRDGVAQAELAFALNAFIYQDKTGTMGDFCLQAGRFYLQEEYRLPCRSLVCLPLMLGRCSPQEFTEKTERIVKSVEFFSPDEVCAAYLKSYEERKKPDLDRLYSFLDDREAQLRDARPEAPDSGLAVREYKNALKMLRYLSKVRFEIMAGKTPGANDTVSRTSDIRYEPDDQVLREIAEEHRKLWLARNKEGGLESGLEMFSRLR